MERRGGKKKGERERDQIRTDNQTYIKRRFQIVKKEK